MIKIINQQKVKRINLKKLKKLLGKVFAILKTDSREISFLLCDNKFITNLNRRFLKKNHPTDVISFPLKDVFTSDYLGEVVVSVEEAVRASKRYNTSWERELTLYLIHGILHLLGYDDKLNKKKEAMEKKQEEIMTELFLQNRKG